MKGVGCTTACSKTNIQTAIRVILSLRKVGNILLGGLVFTITHCLDFAIRLQPGRYDSIPIPAKVGHYQAIGAETTIQGAFIFITRQGKF